MPTIPILKTNTDTRIRNKVAIHSITRGEVSDTFDEVGLELLLRGMPQVPSVADLINESHLNTNLILVPNYGIFKAYTQVFAPDNVDSFFSADIGWLWVRVLKSPIIVPDYSTFIFSGGERTWVTGYNYDVAPSVYQINGVPHAVPTNTNITLAPADPLLDRIDLIGVDSSNAVFVLTGTPADNPLEPSLNPLTQAKLGFVVVKANTTQPVVAQQKIYFEDIEWATVESHPTFVSNSPNNPASGFVDIEATNALPAHNIRFNAPAPVSVGVTGENVLKFRIDPKAAWLVLGSGIRIQFMNGVNPVGVPVLFQNGSYGFDSTNLSYQPVVIPLSAFGTLPVINAVVFTISGAVPTSLGFYLDEIELQDAGIPLTGGRFFEDGGNGWGHTAVLGTKDNNDLAIVLNGVQRGVIKTTDVFQYRGDIHLTGANKGISFFTGTFAASDYYIKRNGTTLALEVESAGIIDLQIGQKSGYTVNANVNRGHEWYDMASPTNSVIMQLKPNGVLSLKKYGLGNLVAAPAYGIGVAANGDLIEYALGGGGGGSVTSVGIGNITNFATGTSTTTNPITAAGQLNYTLNTQAANLVFAGPGAGVAAVPTFRALVAADIPATISASNGLRMATVTNVQLGGAGSQLLGNTAIPTSAFSFTMSSSVTSGSATIVANNSNNGFAILANNTGGVGNGGAAIVGTTLNGPYAIGASGVGPAMGLFATSVTHYGVRGESPNGGVSGFSSGSYGGLFMSESTSASAVRYAIYLDHTTTSTPIVGFGTGIHMELDKAVGSGNIQAAQLKTYYTDVTSTQEKTAFAIRTTNVVVSGSSPQDRMRFLPDGSVEAPGYGTGVQTGTAAYLLAVTSAGKLIEVALGGGGGGGGVNSVTGTANRISIGGTAINPIVDIDANYVGQTSITTLGTVIAGTWNATTISTAKGGTGQTSYVDGEILIGNTIGNTLVKSTISQGIGINIVNGAGSITVHSLFNHAVQFPAVTTSALYTWNVTNGENLRWRISGTGNSLAFSNTIAGRYYTVEVIQNVGGATVTSWPAGTIWFGGIAPTLSTVTGEVDCVVFYYNGINYLAQPNALAGSITPLAGGGTGSNLSDPNADRILFWDDSAGAVTWLTVGSNLTITGTTLDATGGGGGGVTTMAAIGSVPNANGASISGVTLTLQPANGSFGGVVTTATQTFAGAKTFSSVASFSSAINMTNIAVPGTPAAGIGILYPKTSDKKLYWKDDAGVEYDLTKAGTITGGAGGLNTSGANIVLGGTALAADSTISTSAFALIINSSNATRTLELNNTAGAGSALSAVAGGGNAVVGQSTNGNGGFFTSTNQAGLYAFTDAGLPAGQFELNSANNNVVNGISILRNKPTAGGNGIGTSLEFQVKTTTQLQFANDIQSLWTDATNATRTSQMIIRGVNSGTTGNKVIIDGDGTITFPGAPYIGSGAGYLAVSNTGVLSWSAGPGGGSGTVTSVGWTGGIVSIATATTTPAFTIAGTSGGVPYFSSASTWASSAALAANAIVIGGGAGAAPSTTTTGTGVLTALGINVGSAGAFVTFNGALGTPSSGTLTNAAGLPISTGVSGLGSGVATWLATPSSANLATALTTKTGTGVVVFDNTPTITTPVISGAMSTTSIAQQGTTASGTGVMPSVMFVRLTSDSTMSDVNTAQSPFGTSFDVWTVQANTTYWFEGLYVLTHGATSHSVGTLFTLTTATVTQITYTSLCWITAIGTNTASQTTNVIQVATNTSVNSAGSNANETIYISGFISIGTGGTIRPDIQFSAAPGGSPAGKAGSYFRMWPAGADTIQSIGAVA